MNRFLIDYHPESIAKQLCDQHIVKMPLEEAQMLCTSLWHHAPKIAEQLQLYKAVHQKHPCTLWAMETRANYVFAWNLYNAMLEEYTYRYGKEHGAAWPSKTSTNVYKDELLEAAKFIPDGPLTPHPQCFSGHDDLKNINDPWPVVPYRNFYRVDKLRFARYNKGRSMPAWLGDHNVETIQNI